MSAGAAPNRPSRLTFVTLGVALCSLATAMYQGFVQTRNLEIVQRDLARRELVRSCKDVIDHYFEVKLRVGMVVEERAAPIAGPTWGPRPVDAAVSAVSRFAATGTYLANFADEATRARYTALSRELEAVVRRARTAEGEPEKLFEAADGLFYEMNEDCVRSARNMR